MAFVTSAGKAILLMFLMISTIKAGAPSGKEQYVESYISEAIWKFFYLLKFSLFKFIQVYILV